VKVLDDQAEIVVDAKPVAAKAGDLVIMLANHPHALNAVERFKMMLIMIRS